MSPDGLLARTYELAPNAPLSMSWEEYSERATAEWDLLLNSDAGGDEGLIHNFLLQHPCFVPGAHGVTGPWGHAPYKRALLSECPLDGVGKRIPDFIWLANNSEAFAPVFIEIESPCKRWFTKQGEPTHDLTQIG